MRLKIFLSTTLIFFIFSSCQPTGSIQERMQMVLDDGIAEYQVHGVSATIIFPDNKIWTGVSGFSHDTISIKPDMVFGIGSITKNIIAALTLKLVEENRLALEDPISKWLPSFAFVDSTINIRQLLNHTSGLYMFWDNEKIWDELKRDREKFWSPEEVLQYIKEPYFAPGSGWRYSNTNYLLLAMIINKITGSGLSDELRKHFWQPLGIDEIYLSQEDTLPYNQAHVYGDNFQFGGVNKDVTFLPRTSHESITYGSSGIFISSKNLARWSHALFEGNVLKQQSMNEMLQFIEFEPFGNMRAYGLGTQVYDRKFTYGKEAIGHGGGNIGTSTYMVYLPEYHVSIVVMINAFPNEGIDIITKGLIQLVLKDLDALGIIPYFEFFPTGFILLCLGVSVIFIFTSFILKKKQCALSGIWLLFSVLYLSCGSSDPTDPTNPSEPVSFDPPTLEIVSGNNQSNYTQEFLSNPVIVKLMKSDGGPITDAQIQFVPDEGQESTEITDTVGQVYYNWQLGMEYEQKLSASYTAPEDTNITVEAFAKALYRYRKPEENVEWPTAHVKVFEIDSIPLMNMIDAIRSNAFPRIHSVHLVKEGQLFMEENFPRIGESNYTGTDSELHYVASVTKSFTSILVGIALDEGLINTIETPLYSFFTEYQSFDNWSDLKDSITLRDALMMRAGLGCADDGAWESTQDFVKTTLDLPMISTPGTEWRYCSMLTHVLGSAVANASGKNLAEYAQIKLWKPLGITQIRWTYSPTGRAVTGYGFWMRPRDMLKFGQFILNGGEWQGKRIVSKAWIDEATIGWPTGLGGDHYGYQWWVRPAQSAAAPAFYYAAGNGGQMILVVPDYDLVAVFTGGNYDSRLMSQPVTLLERYVLPAIH